MPWLRPERLPKKADRAAEEAASYENRLAKIEADVSIVKRMIGANIALTLIVLGKQLV